MTIRKWLLACLITTSLVGCQAGSKTADTSQSANDRAATQPGETGVEKVKPAVGTGNVQGKVLYNSKPAENIEVKLCQTFNRFLGGCGGQIFTARTDKDGEYVVTNVKPGVYEALTARVFDTDAYVFATTGIGISAAKYEIVADKTLFINPINLFKSDLKTISPKAGAKVSAQNLELKWEVYPDATYYKFSIYPEDSSVTSPYVNQRVEATSFSLDKPLQHGEYRWQVEAFNSADRKLSESADDIKFTIAD